MSTDGILEYQGTKRVLFRGDTSNIVFDTRTTSLGIGVTGSNDPSSNLYITGNAYVSSNLAIGGVMTMGVVNVAARHNLQAVTDMGNVTTHTVEFTNPTTSIVASGNVEVGGSITGRGRFVPKTRTITHGTSLSGEVDTYTLEPDENRIVLNNAQGTAASSRTYTANFTSGFPTEVGTIIYLEINSSRTASAAAGVNHKSEIQFNGAKVLSTGDNYISANGSYSKTLKRVIILTSNGWEDITEIKHGDNGSVTISSDLSVTGQVTRAYNPGEVIEELNSICDGSTVVVQSGSYTMANIVAYLTGTLTHQVITGSTINYTPPPGTKRVYYRFWFKWDAYRNSAISHFQLRIDNVVVLPSRSTVATNYSDGSGHHHGCFPISVEYTIDCNAASNDASNGKFTSWTTPKELECTFRNYNHTGADDSLGYRCLVHVNEWWDGGGTDTIQKPHLTVRAIA